MDTENRHLGVVFTPETDGVEDSGIQLVIAVICRMRDHVKAGLRQRVTHLRGRAEVRVVGIHGRIGNIDRLLIDAGQIVFGNDRRNIRIHRRKVVAAVFQLRRPVDRIVDEVVAHGHERHGIVLRFRFRFGKLTHLRRQLARERFFLRLRFRRGRLLLRGLLRSLRARSRGISLPLCSPPDHNTACDHRREQQHNQYRTKTRPTGGFSAVCHKNASFFPS